MPSHFRQMFTTHFSSHVITISKFVFGCGLRQNYLITIFPLLLHYFSRSDRASTSWRLLGPGCLIQSHVRHSRCPSSASAPLLTLKVPPPSILHPDEIKPPRSSSLKTSLSKFTLHHHIQQQPVLLLLLLPLRLPHRHHLLLLHHHCPLSCLLHLSKLHLPLRTHRCLSAKKKTPLFQPGTCSNKILVRVECMQNNSAFLLVWNRWNQNVGFEGHVFMSI